MAQNNIDTVQNLEVLGLFAGAESILNEVINDVFKKRFYVIAVVLFGDWFEHFQRQIPSNLLIKFSQFFTPCSNNFVNLLTGFLHLLLVFWQRSLVVLQLLGGGFFFANQLCKLFDRHRFAVNDWQDHGL